MKTLHFNTRILIGIFCLGFLNFAYSQTQNDATTTTESQKKCLLKIADKLKEHYIFQGIAHQMDSFIYQEIDSYTQLTPIHFAKKLTTSLQEISKDKHLVLLHLEKELPLSNDLSKKEQAKIFRDINRRWNFGFEEVRRLDGNIGYINYTGFADPAASQLALSSAMNFVANTNALIIDLRENRGGNEDMMRLFCSYFVKERIHLSTTYTRHNNKTSRSYTQKRVSGLKYIDKAVYFLTSSQTFSAGEALPYLLQSYGLAKVIGEQTGGAANPVDGFIIDNTYLLLIPIAQSTIMKTKTNWEHKGVTPDIAVYKEKALAQAHLIILQDLLQNKVSTELNQKELEEKIKSLQQTLNQ